MVPVLNERIHLNIYNVFKLITSSEEKYSITNQLLSCCPLFMHLDIVSIHQSCHDLFSFPLGYPSGRSDEEVWFFLWPYQHGFPAACGFAPPLPSYGFPSFRRVPTVNHRNTLNSLWYPHSSHFDERVP